MYLYFFRINRVFRNQNDFLLNDIRIYLFAEICGKHILNCILPYLFFLIHNWIVA